LDPFKTKISKIYIKKSDSVLDPDPERFSGSGSDMTKKFWIKQLPSDIVLVKQIKILQL